MYNKAVILVFFLSVFSGCLSTQQTIVENPPTLEFDFRFARHNMCKNGISPKIFLGNVPQRAKYLKITLKDEDHPLFNHGGGTVPFTGSNAIPEGALKSYYGPCPERLEMERNKYCFKIEAIDSTGKVVAWGKKCLHCGWIDVE